MKAISQVVWWWYLVGVSISTSRRVDFKNVDVIWGHHRVIWGHISINGCMHLKLGDCSYHSERIFYWYFRRLPGSSEVILGSFEVMLIIWMVAWTVNLMSVVTIQSGVLIKVLLGSSEVIRGHISVKGLTRVMWTWNFVGVPTDQRGLCYWYLCGHLMSCLWRVIIWTWKLGGCIHHSERSFSLVLKESFEVIWGHISIKGRMNLKLGGYSHHSERNCVPLGSSFVWDYL